MSKVFIIFSLFLWVACSQKESYPYKPLIPIDSLNVEIGSPTLIQSTDKQLFVNNSFSGDYCIDVIDIRKDTLLYSFAGKGQGPNEFLQISSIDVFREDEAWYIQLFDNLQRKISIYSIDSLNRYQSKCLPILEKRTPPESRFLEIYRIGDNYIATGRTEKKFTLLDRNLSVVNSVVDYQMANNREDDFMILSKANYGRLYLDKQRRNILSVTFMSGILSKYQISGNVLTKEWEYQASNLDYTMDGERMIQKSPTGYLAAGFIQGQQVLGLYSGEKKGKGTSFAKEFHLLDEEGNLVDKYLTRFKLYNFCVLPDTDLIYAVSYETDPKILVFRL